MTSNNSNFGAVDFAVFAGCLVISALIGVFYAYKDRHKKSTESYLYADGKMRMIYVAISMAVSWASAITVLAFPGEIYRYGSVYMWLVPGLFVSNLFVAIYFIPLIHKLQIGTMFEYLEMRFNRKLRIISSMAANVQLLAYMGVATYLPALALTVVTPLSLEWSIIITSGICTFYTSLGGIKAVIWTDILQSVIMAVGMGLAFIKITMSVGGFSVISQVTERSGRNNFLKFSWDPRVATSIFGMCFGYVYLGIYGSAVNQLMVQRYLCCKTPKKARQALAIHVILIGFFITLSFGNGLGLLTYYEDCNPKDEGIVEKIDQILPLLVVTVFKSLPGVSGIFVAAVYSGTLSTVSSGVNSMASIILNDVVLLVRPKLSLRRRLIFSKIASVIVGITVMLMAYGASRASSTMIQLTLALHGAFCGPILGAILLGVFVPFVNAKGANIGIVCGLIFGLWVSLGNIIVGGNPSFRVPLPMRTDGCFKGQNTTWIDTTTHTITGGQTETYVENERSYGFLSNTFYSLNSMYVGVFSSSLTFMAGLLTSIFSRQRCDEADPTLFVPLIDGRWCSDSVRKFFRFGVKEEDHHRKYTTGVTETDA